MTLSYSEYSLTVFDDEGWIQMDSSEDLYAERAVQLLDIVYDLHGGDKRYPYENIPFSHSEDGHITLSPNLLAELSKNENQHLMGWAHENIKSLF